MRIVFMGTPEFAATALETLIGEKFNVVGVITVPDKPAGRGQQLHESAVKKTALQHQIPVLQPEKLKDPVFIETLKSWNADLQIVVAFRMLPEIVWAMPPKGTFNLHASLLPQYRGAAPINHAIINGEKETGVTTFFITHDIDTGNIIFQERIAIGETENAGSLHDRMMHTGAELICRTVRAIEAGNAPSMPQQQFIKEDLKPAPKIFKESCRIDWQKGSLTLYNIIRGLSPYPAAWTEITNDVKTLNLKIFEAEPSVISHTLIPGTIVSDGKRTLKIATSDGFITLFSLQLEGKKRMPVEDFLRGFQGIHEFRC